MGLGFTRQKDNISVSRDCGVHYSPSMLIWLTLRNADIKQIKWLNILSSSQPLWTSLHQECCIFFLDSKGLVWLAATGNLFTSDDSEQNLLQRQWFLNLLNLLSNQALPAIIHGNEWNNQRRMYPIYIEYINKQSNMGTTFKWTWDHINRGGSKRKVHFRLVHQIIIPNMSEFSGVGIYWWSRNINGLIAVHWHGVYEIPA